MTSSQQPPPPPSPIQPPKSASASSAASTPAPRSAAIGTGLAAPFNPYGKFFSTEFITKWQQSPLNNPEKSEILEQAKVLLRNRHFDTLREFLYELLSIGIRKQIAAGHIANFILDLFVEAKETIADEELANEFNDILCDLLWTFDQDSEIDGPNAPVTAPSTPASSSQPTTDQVSANRKAFISIVSEINQRQFLASKLLKECMEFITLEKAGIIASAQQFNTRSVRYTTQLFYKQQKYNLLREESEGYSKLIIELGTSLPKPILLINKNHNDPEKPIHNVLEDPVSRRKRLQSHAKKVLENIQALIGYFDLDPNRVADMILDVFVAHVVVQHEFFIELLKVSPWAPYYKINNNSKSDNGSKPTSDANAMEVDTEEPVTNTTSSEESGEELHARESLGQLLGFKFTHYQSTEINNNTPSAPSNLYIAAAILIKNGLVNLEDLYAHLTPTDEAISKEEWDIYKKALPDKFQMSEKTNALLQANVLSDDKPYSHTPAPSSGANTSKDEKGDSAASSSAPTPVPDDPLTVLERQQRHNQKYGLLHGLLLIGDIQHARKLLTRLPKLAFMYPEISDLICRLVHNIIHPVYKTKCLVPEFPFLLASRGDRSLPSLAIAPNPVTNFRSTPLIPSDTLPIISRRGTIRNSSTRFFYESWTDQIVPVKTFSGVLKTIQEYLSFIGVHIYRDALLIGKLIKLAKAHFKDTQHFTTSTQLEWKRIITQYFFPAVSLMSANPSISLELWDLVKLFPYYTRYEMYGEWKNRVYGYSEEMKTMRSEVVRATKGVLRRVAKDTIRPVGRQYGKLATSNPAICFGIMMNQIQSYDNMIPILVETCRYMPVMTFDVLGYILIITLRDPSRPRLKEDGTNISQWLQALATFAGQLYRKHPIEMTGIIQYIAVQLKDDNIFDLTVLKELISKMSGIETIESLSDAQLEAIAGGDTLKREVCAGDNSRSTRKSSARLMSALVDSDWVMPLSLLIAQQKTKLIYDAQHSHLKLIGNLHDQTQDTLLQYVEFLKLHLNREQYAEKFPSVKDLCSKFGLDPEVAFHIKRPVLAWNMVKNQSTETQPDESATTPVVEDNTNDTNDENDTFELPIQSVHNPDAHQIWQRGLRQTIIDVIDILPSETWSFISPHFYVTFWQLSLYDIHCPEKRYLDEIARQKSLVQELENDRSDMSYSAHSKRKKEIEKTKSIISDLEKELSNHKLHIQTTLKRLENEKQHWFAQKPRKAGPTETHFYQYCIFPRCRFSANDAIFCARFIFLMHSLGTPNISTLHFFNGLFLNNAAIIFSSTEAEARNYGIFFREFFSVLWKWFSDEKVFEEQGRGNGSLPGLSIKVLADESSSSVASNRAALLLDYMNYRSLLFKFFSSLTDAFAECLNSDEYNRLRNSILILHKISDFYPRVTKHGTTLQKAISALIAKEDRDDLKVLASGYLARLHQMKSQLMDSVEFRTGKKKEKVVAKVVAAKSSSVSPMKGVNGGTTTSVTAKKDGESTPVINNNDKESMEIDETPSGRELGEDSIQDKTSSSSPMLSPTSSAPISLTSRLDAEQDNEQEEGEASESITKSGQEVHSVTSSTRRKDERERGNSHHRDRRDRERDRERSHRDSPSRVSGEKEDSKRSRGGNDGRKDKDKDKEKEKEKEKEKDKDRRERREKSKDRPRDDRSRRDKDKEKEKTSSNGNSSTSKRKRADEDVGAPAADDRDETSSTTNKRRHVEKTDKEANSEPSRYNRRNRSGNYSTQGRSRR